MIESQAASYKLRVNIQRQTACQELWAFFDILLPERNKQPSATP